MKQHLQNFVAAIALLILTLSLTGCRLYQLSVEIPDFDTNQIEGVSLWRLGARTSGEDCYDIAGVIECYHYTGSIIFKEIYISNSPDLAEPLDVLAYYNTQWSETASLMARLERVPGSNAVILRLQYIDLGIPNDAPVSTYRIKTFNAVGDSPISSESIVF